MVSKLKMENFNFLFGIQLGKQILQHTDNLSRALQKGTHSAAERQKVSELSVKIQS